MNGAFEHVVSFLGVISMISLLVAFMLLIHLIQQAFDRSGVVWGMIALIYPPGTYLYCRKNWDVMRDRFIVISGLMVIAIALWLIVKVL